MEKSTKYLRRQVQLSKEPAPEAQQASQIPKIRKIGGRLTRFQNIWNRLETGKWIRTLIYSGYSSRGNRPLGPTAGLLKDPFSASVADVVDFLTSEFQSGKQYSSINSYRAAISNIHEGIDGQPVGKHPIVCRLLQGMFNSRPPTPRYSAVWNVDQVLNHLSKLGENNGLALKALSIKTAMLLAVANADRASDLHLLDISYMRFTPSGVHFTIAALSKTRRSGPPRESPIPIQFQG